MAPLKPTGLSPSAREALDAVGGTDWIRDFYLAGSAALTLHVGHRRVGSLDLMAPSNRLTGPERRDLLQALLDLDAATRVETARDGYLFVQFGKHLGERLGEHLGETPVRFFYYPYPLIDPPGGFSGVDVVSAVDLGLMKLGAIISRGTRRDFVDLYLLCRELPLERLLERADEKFGHVRDFPLQALKGLADLSLVEGEPMPRLAEPLEWETVERWLETEVRRLGDPGSESG